MRALHSNFTVLQICRGSRKTVVLRQRPLKCPVEPSCPSEKDGLKTATVLNVPKPSNTHRNDNLLSEARLREAVHHRRYLLLVDFVGVNGVGNAHCFGTDAHGIITHLKRVRLIQSVNVLVSNFPMKSISECNHIRNC